MRSAMIACKRFKGRHTAENILHEECITSFDINDKIFCVISDNASNLVKAFNFSVPGYTEDNVDGDFEQGTIETENPFPQHKRCYAHSLQLVLKDVFEECGQTIQKVIAKVSKIVSHVRKSIFTSEFLEDEKRLQAINATRWNTQMHMIRSILEILETKLDKLDCANITAYDRKVLIKICKILKPFEDATFLVQREINVSGSMVIPVTLAINLDQSALLASLSKRLSQYEDDEVYKTASMLDTRIKLFWSNYENVEALISGLKKKVSSVDSLKSDDDDDDDDNISPPAKKGKTDDFFSFLPKSTPKKKGMFQALLIVLTVILKQNVMTPMPIL
ncbi:unnamed protein product [Mytilus coruscus]|uniref:HAT C-terminal dimerisation domain-containing protein n=1 Tax=Mytilus coruscus TaxID=42192 RepID=A0A6J8DNV7_MYTCO|nr:unnamed protein product [Mytilus coruscus]